MSWTNTLPTTSQMSEAERDQLILSWKAAQDKLAEAKVTEAQLRKKIVDLFDAKKQGTNKMELGNGYYLKASITQTLSVDKDLDKVTKVLGQLDERVVQTFTKWELKVSKPAYDKLLPEEKEKLAEIITIKDSAPQVELVEPKVK